MSERILVIDDDEHVCDLVRIALEAEGFQVDAALDGKNGLEKVLDNEYALLLLDIMLPEVDGWEICRQIRSSHVKSLPVIMLTARGEEVDRVLGLELGADDYITKPFSPREMAARVKALIRRLDDYNVSGEKLEYGHLVLDLHSYTARLGEEELVLTPKEFELLSLMARYAGKPFNREDLLKAVWGFDEPAGSTRTVDEHIKRLRNKIVLHDQSYTYIQTVWGIGYKFEVKEYD
ncbi:MAG: response regulator transcription factor [Bacillota bacterium]